MEKDYINILLTNSKISKNDIFNGAEFMDYIKTKSKTINLYKDELSLFLYNKIIKDNKNINFELIGRLFFSLVLYTNEPSTNTKELLKNKNDMDLFLELKNIYNNTMLKYFENSKKNKENIKKRYKNK